MVEAAVVLVVLALDLLVLVELVKLLSVVIQVFHQVMEHQDLLREDGLVAVVEVVKDILILMEEVHLVLAVVEVAIILHLDPLAHHHTKMVPVAPAVAEEEWQIIPDLLEAVVQA